MKTSNTVRALLRLSGVKQSDLARHFDMLPQSMNNKLARDSWSANDLKKVAEYTGCKLGFILKDGTVLPLSED